MVPPADSVSCDQSFSCLFLAFIFSICIVSSVSLLLLVLVYEIGLLISGIAYFMMSPEERARVNAERRGRGRASRVNGNDNDDEEESEQRQDSDLERQPLLVAREDRPREPWTMSGFLELFTFNYGTTSL